MRGKEERNKSLRKIKRFSFTEERGKNRELINKTKTYYLHIVTGSYRNYENRKVYLRKSTINARIG